MNELICIICPKGCRLNVSGEQVAGNACKRGWDYGIKETTHPTRVITSTVKIQGALYSRLPVKTSRDIPKASIMEAMAALDGLEVNAPVREGDVIVPNILGTGADWMATRDL